MRRGPYDAPQGKWTPDMLNKWLTAEPFRGGVIVQEGVAGLALSSRRGFLCAEEAGLIVRCTWRKSQPMLSYVSSWG